MRETDIQNQIRLALADTCILFRMNVGTGYTQDGRYFSTGVPKGFSDLFGFRRSDGRAVFIEVKTKTGRVSKHQAHFLERMLAEGAIAGICRSVEDALALIQGGMGEEPLQPEADEVCEEAGLICGVSTILKKGGDSDDT